GGGGGVARGAVYGAVGLTSLADGFVVGFRRGGGGSGGGGGGTASPKTPGGPVIAAGPGAQYTTYATPVMVVGKGSKVSFTNADLPQHDVVSVDKGPDGQPLFRSKLVGIGEVTPVAGIEKVSAGSYAFYCSIHPGMHGTVVVTG